VSLAACGGASGSDEPAPSPGTTYGSAPYVVAVFDVELTAAGTPTAVRVQVSRNGVVVSGAAVTARAQGEKVTLVETAPGDYGGTLPGVHATYSLSVHTPEGGLDDITLAAPAPQETSFDDSSADPKLAWTPCREDSVDDVRITLIPSNANATTYDIHTADIGTMTLQAAELRDNGMWIRLERSSSATLGDDGIGFVHMTTMTAIASRQPR
jgi:hypothetical protein